MVWKIAVFWYIVGSYILVVMFKLSHTRVSILKNRIREHKSLSWVILVLDLQAQSHVNHYMSHSCTRPSLLYLEKKSSIIDAIVTQVRSLASFQALAIANDSFTECVSGSFMEMLTSMLTICINNRFGKGF